MKNAAPQTIRLQDYTAPAYLVREIELTFDLHEEYADVDSKMKMSRNAASAAPERFELDGEKLILRHVKLDGQVLSDTEYHVSDTQLTLVKAPKGEFTLEIGTRIKPQENLTLEGLYKSKGMFCTQCEAQGFRKITYYPDRPDVMAIFTTVIKADKAKYPILLSNGNLLEKKDLEGGRHQARWNDPFKKPAYLYALVAGDLGFTEDHFVTRSGKRVKLEIYVDKGNEDRTPHAMEALKNSMKWDEDTFGLEYDLDIFMIVAVDDFNFGAMENKGLNIFNSSYVLAKPSTATDTDYENIEAVVAHEYFHNWTGNRITCRDWFQLSLKEGLTVYRDQEFSSDMTSRAVCRIDNVNRLRSLQFPEDAGPMAHPIRPSSYIEINNFYTATVYEKGSEVIRMIATILGRDGFRKGMDKFFELFDGQAVTTEDFVKSMELANGADLSQFRQTWYEQAGTPELTVKATWDEGAKKYTLDISQQCPATPGQATKKPFHIPFVLGLLGQEGQTFKETTLHLKKEQESFSFELPSKPIPSFLRGFSAPVKLHYDYTAEELLHLLAKDGDPFARWEAGQKLALRTLQALIDSHRAGEELEVDTEYLEILGSIAVDASIDPALRAQLLTLPDEGQVGQAQKVIHVDSVHAAVNFLYQAIAFHNESRFKELFETLSTKEAFRYTPAQTGARALRGTVLGYLTETGKPEYAQAALKLLKTASNMTDEIAALSSLTHIEGKEREDALHHFYEKWKSELLVMNKWLQVQAISQVPGALGRIQRLMNDPVFNINNPNKVAALLLNFGRNNHVQFHAEDGAAYKFFADLVLDVDTRNPSLASRAVSVFNQWKRYDEKRRNLMKAELERIVAKPGLSAGVFEIASKALQ
ncbi:MAG: aminopeptidase N [Proteobacteria bacterium]|nr:MAG: aminopeptidase N [Pseudomonadota bacterium]